MAYHITEIGSIDSYFKEQQGITIIEARQMLIVTMPPPPPCGNSYGGYFFLVSESDADKMIKLGYTKLTTPLPNTRLIQ